jgi:REP element-mobilizing transposase RayT
MEYGPQYRRRNSLRLKNYDYSSPGAYFLTLRVHNKIKHQNVFGRVVNHQMELNHRGVIAQQYWSDIPKYYPDAILDAFCIMPNHIHGIIWIPNKSENLVGEIVVVGAEHCSAPTISSAPTTTTNYGKISKIIKSFKNAVTKAVRATEDSFFGWQRSFYDHIIRNEIALNRIREYIENNPANWREKKDI